MADYDVREALCEIGRRCWQRQFVAANDGNFSFRLDEDTILATPTRISKGFMSPDDLVLLDMEGRLKGGRRESTSEIRLHLNAYLHRPDIRSVVHVHPPHATAFACTGPLLPCGVLEEFELYLGQVPIVPYEPTGTWEFARGLDPWIETHDAFLLANHGAVTFGLDPFDAYYKMEVLDHACRTLLLARPLGDWRRLTPEQMQALLARKTAHGMNDARMGLPAERLLDEAVAPRPARDTQPRFARDLVPASESVIISDEPKLSSPPPARLDGSDSRASGA
ncbi:MAG: class II aldolase/adducin family protein [Candidatus Sumerlaeia bacterium]|nr:class II aldolase/adducin family protein [Candidatus Sumerlaeia bacterium]